MGGVAWEGLCFLQLFIKSYSKLIVIYPHLVDALWHPTQAD
jgi:hypothetical protein